LVIRAKAELSYQFMDQIEIVEYNPDWAYSFIMIEKLILREKAIIFEK